jgi:hypothetical protein
VDALQIGQDRQEENGEIGEDEETLIVPLKDATELQSSREN